MAASRPFPESLPVFWVLLILVLQIFGARGQDLEVLQTPGHLSLSAGETLTLNCTLTGLSIAGGVRWYKGSDRSQQPIYSDRGTHSPQVIRVVPGAGDDFSIRITNIRPEDAGTYYCVKFRAGTPEKEYKSGKGTVVTVIGQWLLPNPYLCIGLVLDKIIVASLLLYLFLRKETGLMNLRHTTVSAQEKGQEESPAQDCYNH